MCSRHPGLPGWLRERCRQVGAGTRRRAVRLHIRGLGGREGPTLRLRHSELRERRKLRARLWPVATFLSSRTYVQSVGCIRVRRMLRVRPAHCSEWDSLSALSAQETAWRTHLIHPSLLVWREIDSPLLSLNRTPHTPAHKRTSKAFAFAFARSARREALFRNPVALVGARLRHRQSESCRMHDTT